MPSTANTPSEPIKIMQTKDIMQIISEEICSYVGMNTLLVTTTPFPEQNVSSWNIRNQQELTVKGQYYECLRLFVKFTENKKESFLLKPLNVNQVLNSNSTL